MPYDIGKTLKQCRNSANLSVKSISEMLTQKGFKASESTIYSWENGNSQPTPGALLTMCEAYGIDDILSTFGYDKYKSNYSLQLNMYEIDIIEKYRDLDSHGKEMVDFTLEKEWERVKDKEPEFVMPTPEQVLEFINTPDKNIVADAAHSRTDIEVNEGTDTSEDNIMDEKNF